MKLTFVHNGERYVCSRVLAGTKREDGTIDIRTEPTFALWKTRADGQASEIKNPIGMMNSILPSNVRTFFLFDGEKIDNFAKPDSANEVRDAIFLVLKLEVLERAKKHLGDIAADYKRQLKQTSSGELRTLLEEDERKREEKEKALAKLQELERERDSAKRKTVHIDKRLRQLQSARNLQLQRDRIQSDVEDRESELRNLVREIRDIVIRSHSAIAEDALNKACAILDKKRERGEIPSGIRQQFIRDLLEQNRCICGRPIKEGDPAHGHLTKLLARSVSGSLEDIVLNSNVALNQLIIQNRGFQKQLDSIMKRKATLGDSVRSLREELDDVERQLQGAPQEEVRKLEDQRRLFQTDIESFIDQIGRLKNLIETREDEIAQLAKRIAEAKKRKSKDELLMRKIWLAQESADAIEKMYQAFAEEMRQKIEAKTKEIFRKLIWKESHFQDITLGNDYQLEVIDRYGLPARPELSAGERQVLSLSFITAMVKVSEEEAPIVMDTPFGRLSSEHRASITESLPKLAPQLILLVTDEELRDQSRKNSKKHIGNEYQLNFSVRTSCTTIEEVRP